MPRTSAASIASFVLLGAAVLVLVLLGIRSVTTERAVAERDARERLSARLTAAAARVEETANAALGRARRGEGDATAVGGRLVHPSPPRALARLDVPPGRDPYGAWLLARAEEKEVRERDVEAATALYRAADTDSVDEDLRRLALHRLASLRRLAGDAAGARALGERVLAGLDRGRRATLLPALLERVERADKEDHALAGDLLAAVAGPDDAIARGLLKRVGVSSDALRRREEELERRARLAPHAAADGAPERVTLAGAHLVARVEGDDGAAVLAEEELPPLGDVRLVVGVDPRAAESRDQVVETVPLPRFAGARLVASEPRDEIGAAADDRSRALLLGLLVLVVGLLLAGSQTLRAARRERDASAARERFLQRVGHDLRTPLTLVRMYTETLADGRVDDPAEAREFAGIAAREAGRLARMVEGVLDLTRLERPDAPPPRTLDANDLVRSVVLAHQPLLCDAGMRATVELSERTAPVRADADALRGAVGNLIENAVKHAKDGGEVRVRVLAEDGVVRLSIADRGRGFPPGREDEMFERFARAEGVQVPGTGLGLALVREVARRHGGDARACPRPGGGAEVEMVLPRAREESS